MLVSNPSLTLIAKGLVLCTSFKERVVFKEKYHNTFMAFDITSIALVQIEPQVDLGNVFAEAATVLVQKQHFCRTQLNNRLTGRQFYLFV